MDILRRVGFVVLDLACGCMWVVLLSVVNFEFPNLRGLQSPDIVVSVFVWFETVSKETLERKVTLGSKVTSLER